MNGIRRTASSSPPFPDGLLPLAAFLFIWYLITYVLLPLPPVRPGLDDSWLAFLPWAFRHHKQFGTEVIFTYGPWGFLLESRGTFADYPWQVVGRLVLTIADSLGIALLAVWCFRSTGLRWIWAATIMILAEPANLIPVMLFFITMPSGLELPRKNPIILTVAFATGLVACIKFTGLLLAAPLLLLLLIRGYTAAASTGAASFLFFWFAAGQRLANIPAFILRSLDIARGYSSAMVSGHPRISSLLLGLAICGLPALQLTLQLNRRMMRPLTLDRTTLDRAACLLWFAFCQFLLFRHGVVRSDPAHLYMAYVAAAMPVLIIVFSLRGRSESAPSYRKQTYRVLAAGAATVTLVLGLWLLVSHDARRAVSLSLGWFSGKSYFFEQSFRLYPAYARQIPSLWTAAQPKAAGNATVDVFADELSYAIRNDLPLRNRPVIQAYTTYTTDLSARNAAFLESPDAARYIYFHYDPIDARYATLEDNLTWRTLLTHYAPSSLEDKFVVLQRRERPAAYALHPILEANIHTDETLEIPNPAGGLIWAELTTERTMKGRLLDLLYRKEKMQLRVQTDRGSQDFELLDETASGGFLLSPYIDGEASMLELYSAPAGRFSAEDVRRILVHRAGPAAWGFGPNIKIRLYSLTINAPAQDFPKPLVRDLARTLRVDRPVNKAAPQTALEPAIAVQDGELRLAAGTPSSAWIAAANGQDIRVHYGVDGKRSACSSEVSFQILDGPTALFTDKRRSGVGESWSAATTVKLPSPNPTTVKLPSPNRGQRLDFEIKSADSSCAFPGAYWSDLSSPMPASTATSR